MSEWVGAWPFTVHVHAGPDRRRLYVESWDGVVQQMGMHRPGIGVLESLGAQGLSWAEVAAVLDRTFTLPGTAMIALLATLDAATLFQRGALRFFLVPVPRHDLDTDLRCVRRLKTAMDEAGMIGPDYMPAAVLVHLRHAAWFQSLEVRDVDLWFVKEGDVAVIFRVEVTESTGHRTRVVCNVAKDAAAALQLVAAHDEMARLSTRDLRVMKPLERVRVDSHPDVLHRMGLPSRGVDLSTGEWIEGHDELHLYDGDSRFSLWTNQDDADRVPVSREDSNALWRDIIRLHVRLSGLGTAAFTPVWTHINAGDVIAARGHDGRWGIRLIATRGGSTERPASPAAYLGWLLLMTAVDDIGDAQQSPRTSWWGNPDAAIAAVESAFEEDRLAPSSTRALWDAVRGDILPAWLKAPEACIGFVRMDASQRLDFLDLIRATLDRLPTSTSSRSSSRVDPARSSS